MTIPLNVVKSTIGQIIFQCIPLYVSIYIVYKPQADNTAGQFITKSQFSLISKPQYREAVKYDEIRNNMLVSHIQHTMHIRGID